MRKPPSFAYLCLSWITVILMSAFLMTCGGGGGGGGGAAPVPTASVTTTISDQPTCLIPNGSFQNVWVTITRVRAHTSSTAGPNDSGWVDLVNLEAHPTQIDLLSLPSPTCLLTELGSQSGIPTAQYQQIRLHLLSNTVELGGAIPTPNHCDGGGFNCVVKAGGAIETILISSEAQTGIKIPSGQIAGGSFTVAVGQTSSLNIDFNACSSLVQQGNGQFRLKPVLHAGVIPLGNNSISGVVVDKNTKGAIPNAIVFAEQPDPNNPNIDRVIAQTTTGPAGEFTICPLPAGNYDVIATARSFFTYNPTVTLQVPAGTVMGNISLVPETVLPGPATVSGQVTTTNAVGQPTTADLSLSALQPVGVGSLLVTVPPLLDSQLGNSTPNVTSENGSVSYTLVLPASNPQVGTFSISPATAYTPPVFGPAVYQLNAQAFNPMSSGLNPGSPGCNPSSLPVAFDANTQLILSPGATATQNFTFTGCQ